jgi:hypothetical protein
MTAQRRVISAGYTLPAKVFSVVWIIGFGIGTLAMLVVPNAPHEMPKLLFFLSWLGGSAFLFWSALRLKKVTIEGDSLRVSNYLKSISIPVSEIVDIRDASVLPNLRLIVLRLRSPSHFGNKIVFQPSSHSALLALHEAVPRSIPFATP